MPCVREDTSSDRGHARDTNRAGLRAEGDPSATRLSLQTLGILNCVGFATCDTRRPRPQMCP
eukprot:12922323-Alexandrium_andersonii.AAC.1